MTSGRLDSFKVTYIGHASVLMEHEGRSLVADPMFSKRVASVFSRRRSPMDFDPARISGLEGVLISHGHHDHMDLRSLARLGKAMPLVIPKGVSFPLKVRGYRNIRIARPGEELKLGEFSIAVVPSHHFGGRPPMYFSAGYQGYVIYHKKCVYFAGDTGFDEEMFRVIGRKYRLDLAILPIGAYHPPSFRKHHMSPEDAVEAFRLLGARRMMPIHFETFSLSLEPMDEPRQRLIAAAERHGVLDSVSILRSGESIVLD